MRDFSSPPRVIDWDLIGARRSREGEIEAILRDPENRSRMHVPVSLLVDTDEPNTKQLATGCHD